MENTIYLFIGIVLGSAVMLFFVRSKFKLSNKEIESLQKQLFEVNQDNVTKQNTILGLTKESCSKLSKDEVQVNYVERSTYDIVNSNLKELMGKISDKDERILLLTKQLTEIENDKKNIEEKLATFRKEIELLHDQTKDQFKILASDILEEKKKIFVDTNRSEINNILDPLKKDITDFKKTVEDTRKEDIKDLTTLKNEINGLQKLNQQLSEDAKHLTSALKSETKVQGEWGEDRLNTILEAEGLQKYIDYTSQEGYRDEENQVLRKPDLIINLPEGRQLIIDSKVSLTAYVNYFNADSDEKKSEYLDQHIKSLNSHIDSLADKNYQSLSGLNAPDYVFLFMPIESALTLALNKSPELFNKAMKKKIVLTSPTMLVATLKVVRLLWQKESQVRNVNEIFKQCGSLHDKFVLFLESMESVGGGLNQANKSYKEAMDRLKDGARKGDTIIGKFDNIRCLEAKTNKRIPDKYILEVSALDESDTELKEIGNETVKSDLFDN